MSSGILFLFVFRHVLCIQDTTWIDYTGHSGRQSLEDKDFGYGTNKLEKSSGPTKCRTN